MFTALIANVVVLSCSKRQNRQHCTTVLTGVSTENVVLNSGSIYGTPIETINPTNGTAVNYGNFGGTLPTKLYDKQLLCL
jgi:hypothetical protein